MTQEELKKEIYIVVIGSDLEDEEKNLLTLINQHVSEVIGEDYGFDVSSDLRIIGNKVKAEQRKRAGLTK